MTSDIVSFASIAPAHPELLLAAGTLVLLLIGVIFSRIKRIPNCVSGVRMTISSADDKRLSNGWSGTIIKADLPAIAVMFGVPLPLPSQTFPIRIAAVVD